MVEYSLKQAATEEALRKCLSFIFYFLIAYLAFLSFSHARENFSYDYKFYIQYFENIRDLSFGDVVWLLDGRAPYIYVRVEPTGLLEVGFVLLVRAFFTLSGSPELVYAWIATLSLMLRIYVMRLLGIGWIWILVINIYAVTLLEANALRAGCSLTLLVGACAFFLRGTSVLGGALLVLAVLFHIQAAFVVGVIFCVRMALGGSARAGTVAVLAFGLGFSGILVGGLLSFMEFSKFSDYQGKVVQSVGLNSISLTGAVFTSYVLGWMIAYREEMIERLGREDSMLTPIILSAVPALSALMFATSLGAIGDRLWQFSFVILSVFYLRAEKRYDFGGVGGFLLFLCLFVSTVNVIFRYPLSNFFYPVLPYIDIVPEF